jgi:hypothetical protein
MEVSTGLQTNLLYFEHMGYVPAGNCTGNLHISIFHISKSLSPQIVVKIRKSCLLVLH